MYKILMTTDGSAHSLKTVSATILHAKALKAEVTILYVIEGNPQIGYDLFAAYRKTENEIVSAGRKIVEKVAQEIGKMGINVETRVEKGHPATIICDIADKENFNLIILGSRGLGGLTGMILGSVSNAVAHSAKANVLIVK